MSTQTMIWAGFLDLYWSMLKMNEKVGRILMKLLTIGFSLYWAMVQEDDFVRGNNLQLADIGNTQVCVGKANRVRGVIGRWVSDRGSHCRQVKLCLDIMCGMTDYRAIRFTLLVDVDCWLIHTVGWRLVVVDQRFRRKLCPICNVEVSK